MSDFVDFSTLPEEVREKLAELDLELSEGELNFITKCPEAMEKQPAMLGGWVAMHRGENAGESKSDGSIICQELLNDTLENPG